MSPTRSSDSVARLIHELRRLPKETPWVEFKVNNATEPEAIGEYISALANGAALEGKTHSYMVWGLEDTTHDIVGTHFDPGRSKIGNEELESWLLQRLKPKLQFRFYTEELDSFRVVLLEIVQATQIPVSFSNQEWIRIGSYKKKLKEFPERERELWRIFDRTPFEKGLALADGSEEDVVRLLDHASYFALMKQPEPASRAGLLAVLEADEVIRRQDTGAWAITNLGAILFAKQLSRFPSLKRKSVRVIAYGGASRAASANERVVDHGYASGFENLIELLMAFVPVNEAVNSAIRTQVPMYPPLAIRELVANAVIHQDLGMTGAGPMVEIFNNRMEITNPGASLIDPQRLLDNPPRSRNESLAWLMRRMGICEERGSGIDKVVLQTEVYQLPAPVFETTPDSTRAVLFAHRPHAEMDKADRVRACYLHACLKYVNRDFLTNASIRERFGILQKNSAIASRLIKEAVEAGEIVPADVNAARKLMKYVPFWAA
jgi:ATP-dependent DNA helicase RecG